jgi:prepilin-type N-terminal cleavage/methylation domain-containing protein
MRGSRHLSSRAQQAGVTLLEVLIAISLLGICFAALFSVFSTALNATVELRQYDRATECATNELNALALDPTLLANQVRSGDCPMGLRWKAETRLVDRRPGAGSNDSVQLMEVVLKVSWDSGRRARNLRLETLKLAVPVAASKP